MLNAKIEFIFTIFLSLCYLEGFNLTFMDEFEKNKLFANGVGKIMLKYCIRYFLYVIYSFIWQIFNFFVPGTVLREYRVYKVKNKTWYGR